MRVIWETERKQAAQTTLERNLKAVLPCQGTRNIGFPGGNADQTVYSAGEGQLWVAFDDRPDAAVPRYSNLFGIYKRDRPAQTITVGISIAIDSNTAQVAGFFAEDIDTGDTFLMHSGKVGGGRPGIGKSAFLEWLVENHKPEPVDVTREDGSIRRGIKVGKLDNPGLVGCIWTFVSNVQSFKDRADRMRTARENRLPLVGRI